MKITCQSCQSKYNVADDKVQGKVVKIRCRKCGTTIVVQGTGTAAGASPETAAPSAASAASDVEWHVNLDGEGSPRTMPLRELMDAYNTGTITQETFIWTEGMDDWKPLSEVEAVVNALRADAAEEPAPASAYSPPSTRSTESYASHDPPVQASIAESVASGYVAPGYVAPTSIATFAMQAPVEAPSEPKRAAIKREGRSRDLFASRLAGEEVQTSAPSVPPPMMSASMDDAASKLTGERNENSVLFSLAVLTKDASDRPDEGNLGVKATNGTTEDSGLIDLKALAAKAESMRPPSADGGAGAFAPPLGMMSSPFGAPMGALGSGGDEPAKSKLPLIIGAGAGVALLLVLGIFIGVKVAGPSASTAAAMSATSFASPPAASSVEPVASAAPVASTEPAPTASEAPTVHAVAKPRPAYHAAGGGGGATKSGGTASPAAAAPAPKKAGGDCGCNGDLMCLMKCSTH